MTALFVVQQQMHLIIYETYCLLCQEKDEEEERVREEEVERKKIEDQKDDCSKT